jgi:MFS superfamily sulfate permease-like transporter
VAVTPLLALLPQVVLGGVMVTIAFLMADRWSLQLLAQWWRGPRTADLQLALAGGGCGLCHHRGAGFSVCGGCRCAAVGAAVRTQHEPFAGAQPLHGRRAAVAPHLRRGRRGPAGPLRARITVLELEGALFFGSADRIAELADELDAACHTLVLDFAA